jgi:hypothetical protein
MKPHERIAKAFVAQIRRVGNAALSDRFQAAHAQAWQRLKQQGQFIALGLERDLTDRERAQVDAADATEDAAEHLERVQAEASTYLKGLEDGGA